MDSLDLAENRRRMLAGELYYAFTADLTADRNRCKVACAAFNTACANGASRRQLVELWKSILGDETPLPPPPSDPKEEDTLSDYPWVDGPIKLDYGINCKFGKQVYINSNCIFLDTCQITIGARTLIGPNCSFYAANHPTDPFVRNGISGPENGKPITVGEDCWFGGNAIVCPGVTIGRGVTVGAGSVVTKDVPDFVVVAGNPARIIKRLEVADKVKDAGREGKRV
ncbi:acetyltransferase-like protein [Chaetomium strumarium]|uniref:Acetyltransferase-like protein n=1 Tax=Chaetomium strumarium TaxID=1170767 RepID=A0AAJ0GMX0_9PEZI|nr:acetyltransferase-like protein [Chaetomium strumarium]